MKKNNDIILAHDFRVSGKIKKLKGGGSSREYYRITDQDKSTILVVGNDLKENQCFFSLNEILNKNNIRVPEILKISENGKQYQLEDLGDISLFDILKEGQKMTLARKALSDLIQLQTLPEETWIDKVGFKPFSERLIKWDLNYFKYDFLKPAGILFDEEALEDDFEKLITALTQVDSPKGLMYRDFQSRNIMIKDGELWYIDFQGARKGPMVYDAVSFIWQAKAPFSYEEREELGDFYLAKLTEMGVRKEKIEKEMHAMQVFRTLQVLGAYGFRGLIEKKSHFMESIPFAIKNLGYLSEKGRLDSYPEIKILSKRLQDSDINQSFKTEKGNLVLKVFSFSYKKGYPDDKTGNGGGFMFDCRAIQNPGRYEEYKNLTGKDNEVIKFLDNIPEAGEFIDKAICLVVPSIDCYIKRGFTSLQVGFGCTGGQHRSVYCAENFTKSIKKLYPDLSIELRHLEQEGRI